MGEPLEAVSFLKPTSAILLTHGATFIILERLLSLCRNSALVLDKFA